MIEISFMPTDNGRMIVLVVMRSDFRSGSRSIGVGRDGGFWDPARASPVQYSLAIPRKNGPKAKGGAMDSGSNRCGVTMDPGSNSGGVTDPGSNSGGVTDPRGQHSRCQGA